MNNFNDTLLVKKLQTRAQIPQKMNPTDTGFDIYSSESCVVPPGKVKAVSTGIAIQSQGFNRLFGCSLDIQVRSRSGLACNNQVFVLNSPGTIDESYEKEIKVLLFNAGEEDFYVRQGERIAQLVIGVHYSRIELKETEEDFTSSRGGFGSTGKN